MSRKESIKKLREQLIRRRDALHRAIEGDLSMLRELHQERTGDMLDAAADTVQDELNSQLIEAESRNSKRSTTPSPGMVAEFMAIVMSAVNRFPLEGFERSPTQPTASIAGARQRVEAPVDLR